MCSNDTVRIPLYAREGTVIGHTLVDAADAEFVNQWRWGMSNQGYVVRGGKVNGRWVAVRLHRELLGLVAGDKLEADHISMDKQDNRRANLRILTRAQHAQHRPSHRGSSSQFRGVSWQKGKGQWRGAWGAHVRVGGKKIHLGLFTDEDEAGRVAKEARLRLLPYAVD